MVLDQTFIGISTTDAVPNSILLIRLGALNVTRGRSNMNIHAHSTILRHFRPIRTRQSHLAFACSEKLILETRLAVKGVIFHYISRNSASIDVLYDQARSILNRKIHQSRTPGERRWASCSWSVGRRPEKFHGAVEIVDAWILGRKQSVILPGLPLVGQERVFQ